MIRITLNDRPLEGRPGETILELARRHAIEIPALCAEERLAPFDSCGVCTVEVEGKGVVKACSTPISEGMVVATNSPAAEEVRRAALELLLSNHWGDCVAPCQQACPAETDCQAYVSLAGNGRFLDALKNLYEYLPLPACFGRICPAPCEDACRREIAEEPVQIRHMKRFLGDLDEDYIPPTAPETDRRIAVVGGGPAGLSVAYFLRRRGHQVTVFDAMPRMGGMLRYGIPEYRLPEAVIDRELDILQRMGIAFRNGVRLGEAFSLDDLEATHDAVFLGLGAWASHSLKIPGEEHPAVMQGTEFLCEVNQGKRPSLPRRIAVIGGGNTAMDAARCARRLGAEVIVLYRRSQEEMPALEHEVREAKDEGVEFQFLTQPIEFVSEGHALRGVRCAAMELGPPDASGRRRPVPVEGSEFMVDVEAVLLAVGQSVDSACLAGSGVDVTKWGSVVVDEATGATSRPRIFAGGDVVTGPSIAVEAVGAGRRAAEAIDRLLQTGAVCVPRAQYIHVKHGVTREDIGNPATAPRIRTPVRPVGQRVLDFGEYESALTADQAVTAGQRCLECGCMAFNDCALRDYATDAGALQETYSGEVPRKRRDERHPFILRKVGKCISCGKCLRVCSDVCGVSAIDFVGRGIGTEVQVPFNRAWQDSACVSCGACVDVCPTGSLYDRTVLGKQVPLDLERSKTSCVLCGLGCDISVLSLNGAYMRTEGGDRHDVLCARGRYGWHALRDVQRIARPMIRCGSSLVEVSWAEAMQEAVTRLSEAHGSSVVFGTGLLTCEEGWLVSRIAETLSAGAPVFDVNAARPQVDIRPEQVAPLSTLETIQDLVIVVGPRAPHEKVALDVLLRNAMRNGASVISIGARVPGADRELPVDELAGLLDDLASSRDILEELETSSRREAVRGVTVVMEERTISRQALEVVASFLAHASSARLVVIPATANAMGLRRLGFTEELRTSARAWLAVGADPFSTVAGRQHLLEVETLVAVSPIASRTTERAHVVFPMPLPIEARGHVIGARGSRTLVPGAQGPSELETWEVLLRLASGLGCGPLPWQFDVLARVAMDAVLAGKGGVTVAGATPAGIASVIDRQLEALEIR